MTVINREALAERARKMFTVPTSIAKAMVDALPLACQTVIKNLYTLNGNQYLINGSVKALTPVQQYDVLACLNVPNGIKLVLVKVGAGQAELEVHFFNKNYLPKFVADAVANPAQTKHIFPLSGGHRIVAGPASGQVQTTAIKAHPDPAQPVLLLTVKPIGDYSTYKLGINTTLYPNVDPLFSEIDFKFRPGCFNIDCAPEWERASAPPPEPAIDYLAKDFDSFRHTLITAMMERVPGWQPTSEADLDQVLLELFSAAADELSDYQDRVMNEAYLASARKRVSLARHARLMDYHIHQGNQATTWLALELALESGLLKEFDLAPGFKVWAGTEHEDERSVVFLTRAPQHVHQLLNRMGLYTWNDAVPSLAAGSTSADLKLFTSDTTPVFDKASADAVQDLIRAARAPRLLIQEWLNPATGLRAGRDPAKRQLLRLLPGPEGAQTMFDPVTGQWFVRVRWQPQDQLRHTYCFTVECDAGKVEDVSLFHANLVRVAHGRAAVAVFKEPGTPLAAANQFHYARTERWGTLCKLPDRPLAYLDTPPGGDVPPQSTLRVTVDVPGGGADVWDEVPSLVHSDATDENGDHFVVETDEEQASTLRFGNGENGKGLPAGATVRCAYQVGSGPDGNIGADKLIFFDPQTPPFPDAVELKVKRCWNPFDVLSGRAPEPVAEIIRRAPEAYRQHQLRAVTLKDYVARAEEVEDVARASARYAWTGSWRTVQLTIDPVGTSILADDLRRKVARQLEAVRLVGEDLEIRAPRFVPVEIHVRLCARPDVWAQDLHFVLAQEFSAGWTPDGRMGFFHPDRWTFGQPLFVSQITGRVQQVAGVEHVVSVKLKRWNDQTVSTVEGLYPLRHNEIIQVLGDPDHMERGFIDFDVQGGRQ